MKKLIGLAITSLAAYAGVMHLIAALMASVH